MINNATIEKYFARIIVWVLPMQENMIKSAKKVVGFKQTRRAILQGLAKEVYYASDIDDFLRREIKEICQRNDILPHELPVTQEELGRLCRIDVGASVIAILKDG